MMGGDNDDDVAARQPAVSQFPPSSSLALPSSSSSWKTRPAILYCSIFVWISITGGRFIAPFLEQDGHLTTTEIGFALALQQCFSTVFSSTGGSYADTMEFKYPGRGRAVVMGIGIILGTVAYVLHGIPKYFFSSMIDQDLDENDTRTTNDILATTIWHIVLRCIYSISTCLIFPVLDGMAVTYLEQKNSSKSDYGKERVFGAYTWAITNICMAPLLDRYGFSITYLGAILSCVLVQWTIYVFVTSHEHHHRQLIKRKSQLEPESSTDLSPTNTDTTFRSECHDKESRVAQECDDKLIQEQLNGDERLSLMTLLRLLLGNAFAMTFMFALFCLSQGQAVVESLIFLFFEFLGSSYMLMGWTVVFTVAFEIPIFNIAPQLLERWGATKLLLIGCCAYIIRVVGYTFIPAGHVAYVLLLEPLHGVTYACSQTACVDFVANLMPPGYEASGQGLAYLFKGAGSILGLLLGGWAEENIGPRFMYRISALIVAIGAIVLLLGWWNQNGRKGRRPQEFRHQAIPQTDDEPVEIELSSSPR